jgi:hypothetical protein
MLGGAAARVMLGGGISPSGLCIADWVGEPGDPVSGVTEVAVQDNKFSPNSIEIEPGTTPSSGHGRASAITTSMVTGWNRRSGSLEHISTPSKKAGNTTVNARCIDLSF